MSQPDLKKIEELQMILMKNPRSPVFAGLAEAYWKMGLLEEALEVTTKGIRHNPDYVSGLVAHAKVLYEMKDYSQAIQFLRKAHLLKPENILALRLLAHCQMKIKNHKEALHCYKRLLILKPTDDNALAFIRKWEFLDNIIPEQNNYSFELENYDHWVQNLPSEAHALHVIDSFLNYEDYENALEITNMALTVWNESEPLKHRQKLLKSATDSSEDESDEYTPNPALDFLNQKKEFYKQWLQRIESLKRIDPR